MTKRMRVLLVCPEFPPTYWNMRHAMPFIGKRASLPPLGLLTVAAMLPPDCEATLVDENVEPLTDDALRRADLVLTTSMLIQKRSHAEVVRRCKAFGKPVLAGGPYPTSSHEEMEGVDHFVLGEAEGVLDRFFDDFRAGRAARVYRREGVPELGETPPPRFELLRPKAYASMALQFSRGCPHDCEFCDVVAMFGRRPRTKSPAQLLRELERLHATGYRGSLFIVDDNFIGNRREARELLPLLTAWQRERGFPFALFTEATVSLASDEPLLDAMVGAGFNSVFVGIESPVAESLREAHKMQNLDLDLLEAVRRLQQRGLEVSAGFIVGFDGDPVDVFERQIEFVERAGIPAAMVGLLTALPQTRLHRRLAAEGRLLEAADGNNTHDLRLTYVPRMGAERLLAGYQRVLAELYAPEKYFERCLLLLRRLQRHRTSARRIGWTELRALALSLVKQSAAGYRWAYWRYLARALATRPSLFGEAVTMAVKGHHFFRMTASIVGGLGVHERSLPAQRLASVAAAVTQAPAARAYPHARA